MPEPVERTWWTRGRPFSRAELIADAAVHAAGQAITLVLGVLLVRLGLRTAAPDLPGIAVYLGSLGLVLTASMAFNLWPITRPGKRLLARLDQAAIFLFIGGSYTPYLLMLPESGLRTSLEFVIWGGALFGAGLKLSLPHRFGREALPVYVGMALTGVVAVVELSPTLPAVTVNLMLAGGLAYLSGLVFHLWERLRFHNAIWHLFVVGGATLHLVALMTLKA
jgi:hemolysin III